MTPSAEAILAGYPFTARRYGVRALANVSEVQAAATHAATLCQTDDDASAAVFFAFSRRPGAFPGLHALMPILLATNVARAAGRELASDTSSLRRLEVSVALGQVDFDHVRAWFSDRLTAR